MNWNPYYNDDQIIFNQTWAFYELIYTDLTPL